MSTDLALTMTPMPQRCGKPVTKKDREYDKDACCRDAGHKGRHRGWRHPACGMCGQETNLRSDSLTYSCNHPGTDPSSRARAWELGRMQRDVAYAMTGYPDSGQAPTSEQYDEARRIVVALETKGRLVA